MIDKIFLSDNIPITKDYIEYYLENFTFACVVTKTDHDNLNDISKLSMPREFLDIKEEDYLKPWLRYDRANVVVYEIEWKSNVPRIIDKLNTIITLKESV